MKACDWLSFDISTKMERHAMTREELFIRNLFALNNDTKLNKELKLSVLTSFTRIGRILTLNIAWIWSLTKGAQTKRPKTKRPKGQNVPRDKTSQGTKRPKRQNVPRKKNSTFQFPIFQKQILSPYGLGDGPHMYSMLGNELNLWIGYSYFGEVRLGHSFILAILD